MDATLKVSVDELRSPNGQWFTRSCERQEIAQLVYEGLSPDVRDEVAAVAMLDQSSADDSSRELLSRTCSPSLSDLDQLQPEMLSFRQRLLRSMPAAHVTSSVDWSRLVAVATTEALHEPAKPEDEQVPDADSKGKPRPKAVCMEVNSGGQVFFGILAPQNDASTEEAVVIKFCNSRHLLQSEQMAAELAWHLELSAPVSRLLLRVHDGDEWASLSQAAQPLCPDLSEIMSRKQSMLLLQFVPGANMTTEKEAWKPDRLSASASSLGRLLVLDILLGNSDRLPVKSLYWRGNPSNILWSSLKQSSSQSGCVPIDAAVSRRPPKMLVQDEDQKVACLLELTLLDRKSAHEVLSEAVSCNDVALAAVREDWAPNEAAWSELQGGQPVSPHSAVKAFHEGLRSALSLAVQELGLFEMLAEVIQSWIDTFNEDMGKVSGLPTLSPSTTKLLKDLSREANKNDMVEERLSSWQNLLKGKFMSLQQAADAWASRRGVKGSISFRGFLGNSVINPVADAYELLVRLKQMIARAKVMSSAGNGTRPSDLHPLPLFVGPATACCFHLLRKLGVTCIVNCTSDLPEPPEEMLGDEIKWHRLALEDVEDQDLTEAFDDGLQVIDLAVQSGGRVFVHCHEGKSRSVSLCLTYLMTREKRSLADALAFVKSKRPQARPNAGFMRQLLSIELKTLGSNSLTEADLPRGKPKLQAARAKS